MVRWGNISEGSHLWQHIPVSFQRRIWSQILNDLSAMTLLWPRLVSLELKSWCCRHPNNPTSTLPTNLKGKADLWSRKMELQWIIMIASPSSASTACSFLDLVCESKGGYPRQNRNSADVVPSPTAWWSPFLSTWASQAGLGVYVCGTRISLACCARGLQYPRWVSLVRSGSRLNVFHAPSDTGPTHVASHAMDLFGGGSFTRRYVI